MKQTFKIPDGCKEVTIDQIGNQLITTFEPEKYVPKAGDLIKFNNGYARCLSDRYNVDSEHFDLDLGAWIPAQGGKVLYPEDGIVFDCDLLIEIPTPDQFQSEFSKLGYVYDFETNTASKKRWRASINHFYYKLDGYLHPLEITEKSDSLDDVNFNNNNYFKTIEQAQEAADFLKQQLKEFNEQNN